MALVLGARAVDWRFLLPSPVGGGAGGLRLRLVARRPGLDRLLRELGGWDDVTVGFGDEGDEGDVDAAAVLTNRPDDVVRAARTVRPGGVVYCEIDRGRLDGIAASPARLRRRLAEAGLETTLYWRRRQGGYDTVLLPLDVPGAVRWYLTDLMDPRRLRRRAARRVLLHLARRPRTLGAVVRRYALVATAAEPGPAHGLAPAVLAPAVLAPAVLATAAGASERPVVLARGQGAWSRVVLLPFGPEDAHPRRVIKLPRTAEHNDATTREQHTLARLRAHLGGRPAAEVPEPVGLTHWHGLAVGVETFVPGRPLSFAGPSRRQTQGDWLAAAVDWLAGLHHATLEAVVPVEETSARAHLDRPVVDALALLPDGEEGLRETFAARSATQAGLRLPVVLQHADVTPRNLRWDGRTFSLVDWESARSGPALCDLLYLLLHWQWPGLSGFAGDPDEVFRAVFAQSEGLPAVTAASLVGRYCEAMGVDRRLVPALLLVTLGQQALDRADRVRDGGGDPALDDNVYLSLLVAALRSADRLPAWL